MNADRSRLVMLAAAVLVCVCSPAPHTAESRAAETSSSIEISDAWAATTPPGARAAAGYLTITNTGPEADTLLMIASPRAAHVALHETQIEGDIARMRAVHDLVLAPGETLLLAPGGHHLMFVDIMGPFVTGENVAVTLTFAQAGTVETLLPVHDRDVSHGGNGHAGHDGYGAGAQADPHAHH